MKLHDINENVIDFKAARERRDAKKNQVDVAYNLQQLKQMNLDVDSEVELLADWFSEFKGNIKIPKFDSLDKVFQYLTIKLHMPSNDNQIAMWFRSLSSEDKANVEMLSHHAPRMQKIMSQIRSKVAEYKHHAESSMKAYDTLSYIYSEIEMDEGMIRALMSLQSLVA